MHQKTPVYKNFKNLANLQLERSALPIQSQTSIINEEFPFIIKQLNVSRITHWATCYACKHIMSLFRRHNFRFFGPPFQEASGSNIMTMCNYMHATGGDPKIDEENVKNQLFALLQSKIISKIASKIMKTVSALKLSAQGEDKDKFEFLPDCEKMTELKECRDKNFLPTSQQAKKLVPENEFDEKRVCEIENLKVFHPAAPGVLKSQHKTRFFPGLVRKKLLETLSLVKSTFSSNEFIQTMISHIARGDQTRRSDQHRFRRQIPNAPLWEMRLMKIIISILFIALATLSVIEVQTHSHQLTPAFSLILLLLIPLSIRFLILKASTNECSSNRMEEARRLIKTHTHPWRKVALIGQENSDSTTNPGTTQDERAKGKQIVNEESPTPTLSEPLLSTSQNVDDESEQLECSICLEELVSSNSIENESTSNTSTDSQEQFEEDGDHRVDLEAQNSISNIPVKEKEESPTISRRLKAFVKKLVTKCSTQTNHSQNEDVVQFNDCSVCHIC